MSISHCRFPNKRVVWQVQGDLTCAGCSGHCTDHFDMLGCLFGYGMWKLWVKRSLKRFVLFFEFCKKLLCFLDSTKKCITFASGIGIQKFFYRFRGRKWLYDFTWKQLTPYLWLWSKLVFQKRSFRPPSNEVFAGVSRNLHYSATKSEPIVIKGKR